MRVILKQINFFLSLNNFFPFLLIKKFLYWFLLFLSGIKDVPATNVIVFFLVFSRIPFNHVGSLGEFLFFFFLLAKKELFLFRGDNACCLTAKFIIDFNTIL